eukprot:CAMPEP_0116090986 /NCGR_PEP_ID=MMETSP0327-20121206/7260_1 /TAXON_ID=44447 /ORGANISM="Pseudo-nitzschia delicatissima, Strain B596" /LENGTH=458 /DNA_ID=CAMNT_0003582299 /DNA_START=73 /DNA_END=1449 /DNA_ORIENTATION=-
MMENKGPSFTNGTAIIRSTRMLFSSAVVLILLASANTAVGEEDSSARVAAGAIAYRDDHPYYVQVGGCGGALIAPDVVLTAAHCRKPDEGVIVGAYKRSDVDYDEKTTLRYCDEWIKDPLHKIEDKKVTHDFALCKLDEPVYIDQSRVRLELNRDEVVPVYEEDLLAIGMGDMSEKENYNGKDERELPEFLQQLTVTSLTNEICNSKDSYDGLLTDNMLCAGYLEGGKGVCRGDSGGPLVKRIPQPDGTFVDLHVGAVSWGYGCAQPNYPGVYSRTSAQFKWIRSTMCEELQSVAAFCNTDSPSASPSDSPTISPAPSSAPSESPAPSVAPSVEPTLSPSNSPAPSKSPSPSAAPSVKPEIALTAKPTSEPTKSAAPTKSPQPTSILGDCKPAFFVCESNSECCPGHTCRVRVFNGPKYCSRSATKPRDSIANSLGVGGAAGRSRARARVEYLDNGAV